MEKPIFAVIGQDGRQQAAAQALRQKGYTVTGPEQTALADYILLPMPLCAEQLDLTAVFAAAKPGAVAFAGRVNEQAQALARQFGIELCDYLLREELAVLNAIPTCEGALEILLRERNVTLWQARVVITGFGRIAKLLAPRLLAMGAKVTVAARKPSDRAMARAMGLNAVPIEQLESCLAQSDIAVNTVPARLIEGGMIAQMDKNALLLDLASAPGGIDLSAAGKLGVRAVWALSLPAKCAPVTAGQFVADTVLQMIAERS